MTGTAKTIAAALGCAALGALLPAGASAQGQGNPTMPYDGHMPFNCELQDVGLGTDFPHPEADPFCVEFDKTQQNVTDLGLIDFASREPARVAAAAPKCFYFQRDHWTGSIVQGTQPETYHFDGSYFYDESTGEGGVHIDNFRIGGQPADSSQFVPPDYKQYFGMGGGGAYLANETEVNPQCTPKVDTPRKRKEVYYHLLDGGRIFRKRIPPFRLGTLRADVLDSEGIPYLTVEGTDRFNVNGGGQLRIAYAGHGEGTRISALLSTSPADRRGRIHPGVTGRAARRKLHARFAFPLGSFRVFEQRPRRHSRLLLGISGGKLAWIAVANPRRLRSTKALKAALLGLATGPTQRVDSARIPY